MILKIFSVYDSKVEAYMSPFFMSSRGQAIRSFADTAADVNTMIGKHPSDYTLFEIGEFNDQNCRFALLDTPHSLGVALEMLASTGEKG